MTCTTEYDLSFYSSMYCFYAAVAPSYAVLPSVFLINFIEMQHDNLIVPVLTDQKPLISADLALGKHLLP